MLAATTNPITADAAISDLIGTAPAANPIFTAPRPKRKKGKTGIGQAESEMKDRPHLASDRTHRRRQTLADLRDARRAESAAEAIGELPEAGESIHVVISGRYSLWDCVPAIIETGGEAVESLYVATLGFSKRNVEAMSQLMDDEQIGRLRLLASHYFKGTNRDVYAFAVETLARHPQAEFLSLRTHCKILLVKTASRSLVIESSANLRSCKNLEQMVIVNDAELWRFHAAWMDQLFHEGREHCAPKKTRD